MFFAIKCRETRDLVLRNGGQVVMTYPDGWLVDVAATRLGAVTYQLPDGSLLRLYDDPEAGPVCSGAEGDPTHNS